MANMDKQAVLQAYLRGFLSVTECAQIIGVDNRQMIRLLNDPRVCPELAARTVKRPAGQ